MKTLLITLRQKNKLLFRFVLKHQRYDTILFEIIYLTIIRVIIIFIFFNSVKLLFFVVVVIFLIQPGLSIVCSCYRKGS